MGFKTSILLQYNDHILFPSPRQYPRQRDLAHRGVFQLLGPPPLCKETRKRDRRDKCFFTAWGVGALLGSAAGCPVCGRHPDLTPLLLLTWIFQRPPTSPSSPSAPALGDSPHCFLLLGPLSWQPVLFGGILVRQPQTWLPSTASLWSTIKSHIHHQMLSAGHGSYYALPLLAAPLSSSSSLFHLLNWAEVNQPICGRSRQPIGEWAGSRKSVPSQCSQPPALPRYPPPPPHGCRRPPGSLSSWFLSAYVGWKQVAVFTGKAKFNYFLISPEKDVWFLVIYYLFFSPWYLLCSQFWIAVVNSGATGNLSVNILDIVLGPLYIHMISYEPQNSTLLPIFYWWGNSNSEFKYIFWAHTATSGRSRT